MDQRKDGPPSGEKDCPSCKGSGKVAGYTCAKCKGSGCAPKKKA